VEQPPQRTAASETRPAGVGQGVKRENRQKACPIGRTSTADQPAWCAHAREVLVRRTVPDAVRRGLGQRGGQAVQDCSRSATPAGAVNSSATRTTLALVTRALVVAYGGDVRTAADLVAAARRQAQRAGDVVGAAWARYAEGEVLVDEAPERALVLLEGALRSARELGDRYLTGVALVSRASVLGRWGDPRRARPAFLEVVEHWREAGDRTHQWTTLRSVVPLLLRLHEPAAAARLLGALTSRRTAGRAYGADAERLSHARAALAAALGPDCLEQLLTEGAALADDDVVRLACAALR